MCICEPHTKLAAVAAAWAQRTCIHMCTRTNALGNQWRFSSGIYRGETHTCNMPHVYMYGYSIQGYLHCTMYMCTYMYVALCGQGAGLTMCVGETSQKVLLFLDI